MYEISPKDAQFVIVHERNKVEHRPITPPVIKVPFGMLPSKVTAAMFTLFITVHSLSLA